MKRIYEYAEQGNAFVSLEYIRSRHIKKNYRTFTKALLYSASAISKKSIENYE